MQCSVTFLMCLTNAFTVLLKVCLQACICAHLDMEFDTDCTFAISFSFAKAKHVWPVDICVQSIMACSSRW